MDQNQPSLPCAKAIDLAPGVTLQPPLSRRGRGPCLVVIRPAGHADAQLGNGGLDPAPGLKWAEESFGVAVVSMSMGDEVKELVGIAVGGLREREEIEGEGIGLLVYGSKGEYPEDFESQLSSITTQFTAAICFDVWNTSIPTLFHLSTKTETSHKVYIYDVPSPNFILPGHADFKPAPAGVAHTRSLTFLKKALGGPYFDLEKIWDEHTFYEFGDRSVEKTMATMVQEPYVNHVPTMTGGIGRASLSKFYLNHFIFSNPDDTSLELISRTVGVDRVVDEFIFCLTHTKQIDWLIPGIPPTNRPLRIPFTSVVNIRGDRLYHEHIAWDQATVLVQLGLMPTYLPFPYALPGDVVPAPGRRFEYRVPAAGAECADKMRDEGGVVSNGMIGGVGVREVVDL